MEPKLVKEENSENREEKGGLQVQDRKGAVLSYRELKDLEREVEERTKREYGIVDKVPVSQYRNPVSLGARFEDVVNQKLTDEFMGTVVNKMFGGGVASQSHGITGGILGEIKGILDTKFGYALGEKVGSSATELVKMFGVERIGAMMDAASGKVPAGQQTVPTPEQQKQSDDFIIGININDPIHVDYFMKQIGISDVSEAKKILMGEQNRIRQSRGMVTEEVIQKPKDINRQLVERYDNPNAQPPNFQQNDIFPIQNAGFQQSPEEIILSMNPDDPISIQQYAALRNISGVDYVTIKKKLMEEQRKLLEKTVVIQQNANTNEDKPVNEYLIETKSEEIPEQVAQPVSTPPPTIENQILDAIKNLSDTIVKQGKRLDLLENKKSEIKQNEVSVDIPVEEELTPPIIDSVNAPIESNITPPQESLLTKEIDDKDIDVRESVKEEVKESGHKKKFTITKKSKEVDGNG